jgi:hypothetical protein
MNIQEEFEKWYAKNGGCIDCTIPAWNACAELMQVEIDRLTSNNLILKELTAKRYNEGLLQGQANMKFAITEIALAKENFLNENERLTNELLKTESVIEEQDADLAALRGFAKHVLSLSEEIDGRIVSLGYVYKLIDGNGETPLLKGE